MRNCIKGETGDSQGELKNAAKECKAEQAADPVAFEETYGDDGSVHDDANAYGKCVSSQGQADDDGGHRGVQERRQGVQGGARR